MDYPSFAWERLTVRQGPSPKNQAVACASDYGFLISSVVGAHEVWRI
jgi:hypothetical protein